MAEYDNVPPVAPPAVPSAAPPVAPSAAPSAVPPAALLAMEAAPPFPPPPDVDLYDDDDPPFPPRRPVFQSNVGAVIPPPAETETDEDAPPFADKDRYASDVDGLYASVPTVPVVPPKPAPVVAPKPPGLPVVPPPGPPVDVSSGIALAQTRRNVNITKGGRGKTFRSKKGGEIVAIFFNIRDQIKLYHWQTKSFAEHKATDDLVTKLDTSIDMFVESYMGRYGRPQVNRTYPLKNLTVSGVRAFIVRSDQWLSVKLPRTLKKTDSDLLNIRDEILADLNQIKYLFTLS